MYLKKSMASLAAVGLLAVGYVAGAYFQFPFMDNGVLSGSINKVKAFNQTNDPEVLAAMEQLASDTTRQNDVALSSAIIATRIYAMDSLAQATVEATEGIEQLADVNEGMKKLVRRTQNARSAYDKFMEETAKVMEGKKSEEFEQASNNALLAYTVLENNLASCPTFIDVMADYLRENKNDAVDKVAVKWIEYCAEDAVLNQDPNEIAQWEEVYNNASNMEGNLGKSTPVGQFPSISMTLAKVEKVVPNTFKVTIGNNGRYKKVAESIRKVNAIYSNNVETAMQKNNIDAVQKNNIDAVQKNNVAAVQKNNVAAVQKNNVAAVQKNNVAAVQKNNIAAVQKNNISAVQKNNVAAVQKNNASGLFNTNQLRNVNKSLMNGFVADAFAKNNVVLSNQDSFRGR